MKFFPNDIRPGGSSRPYCALGSADGTKASSRSCSCGTLDAGNVSESAARRRFQRLIPNLLSALGERLQAVLTVAVVTVGVLQAGTKENVIPEEAIIRLNIRTFDEGVRKHVLAAIERIVNAEAQASGAPRVPEITPLDRYPLNVNDKQASDRVAEAMRSAAAVDQTSSQSALCVFAVYESHSCSRRRLAHPKG